MTGGVINRLVRLLVRSSSCLCFSTVSVVLHHVLESAAFGQQLTPADTLLKEVAKVLSGLIRVGVQACHRSRGFNVQIIGRSFYCPFIGVLDATGLLERFDFYFQMVAV